MKALSLFSGIGGLDLAAEMAGIMPVAFCEIEEYPVKILNRRCPMAGVRKVKIVVEVPIKIGNDDGFYCGEGCGYLINFERCAVCGLFNVPLKKKLFIFRCGRCLQARRVEDAYFES